LPLGSGTLFKICTPIFLQGFSHQSNVFAMSVMEFVLVSPSRQVSAPQIQRVSFAFVKTELSRSCRRSIRVANPPCRRRESLRYRLAARTRSWIGSEKRHFVKRQILCATDEQTETKPAENPTIPSIKDIPVEPNVNLAAVSFDEEFAKEAADDIARKAISNTIGWVSAAMAFAGGIYYVMGVDKAAEFVSGYLVEQSLSIDNLFVFLLVFRYFQVPIHYQPRVLRWGLLGAALMRAVVIGVGTAAISNFKALFLGFAAVLLLSSYKLLTEEDDGDEDLSDNQIVKFARRLVSVSDHYDGDRFFNALGQATPLLLVLLVIELSDIVFAVDSIPAVFGVTSDPFIVYSSNMFAILSLRSIYQLLSSVLAGLRYLQPALAIVLGFIGVKMIAEFAGAEISNVTSLSAITGILGVGVLASIVNPHPAEPVIDPSEPLIDEHPKDSPKSK